MKRASFARSMIGAICVASATWACAPKENADELERLRRTLSAIEGASKHQETKTASEQLQRTGERAYIAPLYKNIAEYYCTNGNGEGDFFAYNTKTGREIARSNTDDTTREIREWVRYNGDDIKRSDMRISNGNWVLEIEYTDEPGSTYRNVFNPESQTMTRTTRRGGKTIQTYTDNCLSAALPFQPTAESFEKYLNRKPEWKKGKKITFSSLDNCSDYADFMLQPSKTTRRFFCRHGYASIKSPLGIETCELGKNSNTGTRGVVYEINFRQEGTRLTRATARFFGTNRCELKPQ